MAMLFNLAVRNFQSMTRKELPISNITVSTGVSSFAQTHESVKVSQSPGIFMSSNIDLQFGQFPPQKHSEHTLDDDLELSPVGVKV